MEVARDVFVLAVAGGGLLLALGAVLGWIEIGPAWWIFAAVGVVGGVVKIALGLLSSLADLLAGCRD